MKDLVSVIIPTFKRATYLSACVQSVLKQTYEKIEIIVVDDNDPNTEWRKETERIVSQFENNNNFKYIKHDKNINGSAARNTGFRNSSGEYICFLDDDDLFYSDKIFKQVSFLKNNSSFSACCCDYIKEGKKYILKAKNNYTEDILLQKNTPQTSGIMFRKKAIMDLNGFDETYIRHQDYELLLRFFSNNYKMYKINEIMYERKRTDINNVPNGFLMEGVKKKFLIQFLPMIDEISISKKGFKRKVFVANYFTIFKCYLKEKNKKKVREIKSECLKLDFLYFIHLLLSSLLSSTRYRIRRLIFKNNK